MAESGPVSLLVQNCFYTSSLIWETSSSELMNPSHCRFQKTHFKRTVTISLRSISLAEKITLGEKAVNRNHCISSEPLRTEQRIYLWIITRWRDKHSWGLLFFRLLEYLKCISLKATEWELWSFWAWGWVGLKGGGSLTFASLEVTPDTQLGVGWELHPEIYS